MDKIDPKEKFVANADAYWLPDPTGSAKAANKCEADNQRIVKKLAKEGNAEEFLSGLLEHERDTVKYAAAAHLLGLRKCEAALSVLRTLRDGGEGLMSLSSKMILELHGFEF